MGLFFTGKELVNVAVGIERNGAAFYDAISASSKDDTVRNAFQYLADSEREHIDIFQKMLSSVEVSQPIDTYTEEYETYLQSLIDSAVFGNEQEAKDMASRVGSADEAIQIGLTAEKESILFYSAMQDLIRRSEQEVISEIIDEEKSHLRQLLNLKEK